VYHAVKVLVALNEDFGTLFYENVATFDKLLIRDTVHN